MTPEYTEDPEAPRYGVPVGLGSEAFVYYNKKLFKKAGLPTDFQPKTWEEVEAAGKKLQAAGIQPFGGGNKEGYENDFWFFMGWPSFGTAQQAIELANGELPFTDKVVEEAYGPSIEMQEAGLYPADRFSTPLVPEGVGMFEEGHAAMAVVVAGSLFELREKLGEENFGLFQPPGAKYGQVSPNFGASVPKFAKNKEAAWAYAEFLASQEAQEIYLEKSGLLPNREDVKLPADAPSQFQQLLNIPKEYSSTLPVVAQMIPGSVLTTLRTEMSQVLQGRQSLQNALSAAQETAEKSTE
jgi:multiple sugar transport system substrate-binding protein